MTNDESANDERRMANGDKAAFSPLAILMN